MISIGRLCPFFLLGFGLLFLGCDSQAPAPKPVAETGEHHDDDHEHMGEDEHGHHEHGHHDHEHGDHEEHHESYAEAVAELETLRGEVKEAMAGTDPEKADGPVHEIGHILTELPELAAKDTALAADDTIKPAVDDLFECFDQLDRKLHGEGGKGYDEVADRIDAGMATLRSKVKAEEK